MKYLAVIFCVSLQKIRWKTKLGVRNRRFLQNLVRETRVEFSENGTSSGICL